MYLKKVHRQQECCLFQLKDSSQIHSFTAINTEDAIRKIKKITMNKVFFDGQYYEDPNQLNLTKCFKPLSQDQRKILLDMFEKEFPNCFIELGEEIVCNLCGEPIDCLKVATYHIMIHKKKNNEE